MVGDGDAEEVVRAAEHPAELHDFLVGGQCVLHCLGLPDTRYLLMATVVSAAVTWALRALPFAVLTPCAPAEPSSTSAPAYRPVSW